MELIDGEQLRMNLVSGFLTRGERRASSCFCLAVIISGTVSVLKYFSSCLSLTPDPFIHERGIAFLKDQEAVTFNYTKLKKISSFPLIKNESSYSLPLVSWSHGRI